MMSKKYTDSLPKAARERYIRKLQCLYGVVGELGDEECLETLDPYKLPDDQWVDDLSKWPPVDYPNLYTYLIEMPGEFTREKLKAFKSLEAYNYYQR